jgi:hypothetical protein
MVQQTNEDYIFFTIVRIVFEHTKITYEEMKRKTRKREIVQAKQIAISLIRANTKLSLKSIGIRFGGLDHSTCIHACNTIEDLRIDKRFNHEYETIREAVLKQIQPRITPSKIKFEMKRINLIRKYNSVPCHELATKLLTHEIN